MELVKAIPLGGILSYVFSVLIGSQGRQGGHLNIFHVDIHQYELWWSWPLFFAATFLAWSIMALQR